MARAMMAGNLRRWQDTALNLSPAGDGKGAPDVGLCPSSDSGGSSADVFRKADPQMNSCRTDETLGVRIRPLGCPLEDYGSLASASNSPRSMSNASEDSQFVHVLFPEVVASFSKEQRAAAAKLAGPLGLKLNHADVLEIWEGQKHVAAGFQFGKICPEAFQRVLQSKSAKAALEASCGPLPCYDLNYAFASAPSLHMTPLSLQPQHSQCVAPVSAFCPTPDRAHLHPLCTTLPSHVSRAGSMAANSSHDSCSTGSLTCTSSPVSYGHAHTASQTFESSFDKAPMEIGTSFMNNDGCLQSDLDEFMADLNPLASFSKSEDASEGTIIGSGHLWGGSEDAYDSIFGSADADASMEEDSCGFMFAESGIVHSGLAIRSLERHNVGRSSNSILGTCSDFASYDHAAAVSPLSHVHPDNETALHSVISSGDLIDMGASPQLDGHYDTHMPMIPLCSSLLQLHNGPSVNDVARPDLPQSLVTIPAKSADCAKSARAACAAKCKEKRQQRHSGKICYEMRKINADKRPRIKGRFVKRADMLAQQAEQYSRLTEDSISDNSVSCFTYPLDPHLDNLCSF